MEADPKFHISFYSDKTDRRLGALERVFGNIYDFGSVFTVAPLTIPNVYGPIMLVFRPEVFSSMTDICITKQSIATLRDGWRSSALSTESELDELLSGDDFGSPISRSYRYSELSCANSRVSLEFLEEIIVEPLVVHGVSLLELVRDDCDRAGLTCPVIERTYRSLANRNLLRDLVSVSENISVHTSQQEWVFNENQLPTACLIYPRERKNRICLWMRYFYFGTSNEVYYDLIMNNEDDDRTICTMCSPGEDRPPPMVNYQPWAKEGETEARIDLGYCDWCNGITIRCRKCGETLPVYEHEYDQPVCCPGECGLRFRIESYYDEDGILSKEIDILPDGDPEAMDAMDDH